MRALPMLCLVLSTLGLAQPFEAASVKAYKGPEGQLVEVVLLKPIKDQRALVRVSGADSPADGLVVPASIAEGGANRERGFTARIHGADWTLLRLGEGQGSVYAPDVKEFAVKFDEAATAKANAADLISKHQEQWASGAITLLAKKEFPNLLKKYQAKAVLANQELGKACGLRLDFGFAWETFSDADMENLDVWSLCQPLVTVLRTRCGALKDVRKMVCKRGPAFAFDRKDETLTFTTTEKGASEGAAFLIRQLAK